MNPKERPTNERREWLVVLAITIIAALIRVLAFGRLGLSHFDEGVYAFSGLWSLSSKGLAGMDPQVIAYAPPGFPILVGLSYAVLGVSDASAILVSVVAGVLTVPAAAWLGRRTFGHGAGAAAAAFAALSMAHVAFSRKALTDAPFLLCWIVSLGLGGRFLERPTLGRAIALGLAVGLAQNVKYNGGVAGVIVALAAVLGLLTRSELRKPSAALRTFGLGALAGLVAAACYWPWYAFVETQPGGYAALARHHRSYLGGTSTWITYWRCQLAQVVALSGGVTWGVMTWLAAGSSALIAVGVKPADPGATAWHLGWVGLGVLVGGACQSVAPDLGWWVGLVWVPWLLVDPRPSARLLAGWWLLLSVMTPFYHPYARLWLPLHAVGWLLTAGLVSRLGQATTNRPVPASITRASVLFRGALATLCLVAARLHWGDMTPHAIPPGSMLMRTDQLRLAVADLLPVIPDGGTVRVYGRRPIAFYLALQGRVPFRLVPDEASLFAAPSRDGEGAIDDRLVSAAGRVDEIPWDRVTPHWSPLISRQCRLDPVTLLDVNPGAAFEVYRPRASTLVLLWPRGAR